MRRTATTIRSAEYTSERVNGLLERRAYLQSKPGKGLLAEKLTNDYFHLERHGHHRLQDERKKLQREQVIQPIVFQANGRSGLLEERQANLQKGRHESLYRNAGFIM